MISFERAEELIQQFGDRKVLVVGDLMLDRYVSGSVSRISPEAPVPVVCVESEYSRPGGAANVALNVQSLGGQAVLAGIVGEDPDGTELTGVLRERGIDTRGVVYSPAGRTTVKTRILAERQQVVRVDRESCRDIPDDIMAQITDRAVALAGESNGVIIEDYGKGLVSQGLLNAVVSKSRSAGIAVGLDPKFGHDLSISGITLATPNYKEACSAAGISEARMTRDDNIEKNVLDAGNRLMEEWDSELLLITLGPKGMCLLTRDTEPKFIPTKAREVFDVSGAGDTVIATAILALVAGASHVEAASLANYAAGVVVAKLGTATCSSEELLQSIGQGSNK